MNLWIVISLSGLLWVISVSIAGFVGYKLRDIQTAIKELQEVTKAKQEAAKKTEPAPTSSVIDPTDLIQRAQYERDEQIRKLNS